MDLVPYVYGSFDGKPIKVQTFGLRPDGATRGDVSGGTGPNTSTAPKDWWPTYNVGGNLNKDLAIGFRRGFGKAQGFG
jgi:hypothetical protein